MQFPESSAQRSKCNFQPLKSPDDITFDLNIANGLPKYNIRNETFIWKRQHLLMLLIYQRNWKVIKRLGIQIFSGLTRYFSITVIFNFKCFSTKYCNNYLKLTLKIFITQFSWTCLYWLCVQRLFHLIKSGQQSSPFGRRTWWLLAIFVSWESMTR